MKLLSALVFILSPMAWSIEKCLPRVESCGFYLCEERNHHCGPKGYPLGFGFKICQIFLHSEQEYSSPARQWLRQVRVCLMEEFQKANDSGPRICQDIKRDSFRSHVGCYVSTGFCELSAHDQAQIFWPMRSSLIYSEVLQDIYSIAQICASRIKPNPEGLSAPR